MSKVPTSALDSGRAWLIACAAFVGFFVTFGFLYAFGVFLKPMASELGVGHAAMSALFSLMSVLSYVLGPLTGDIADRTGPRKMVLAGALFFAAALMATAHAANFLVAFLCLGIGIGAARACVFVRATAAVGEWFKKNRDVALGVASSGIGIGTLVAAPLAAFFIGRHGWRGTMTILGAGGGILLLLSALLMAPPPVKVESKASGRAVWAKVRTSRFLLLYLSKVLSGVPVFIAILYLPAFAGAEGIGRVSAAALVGYLGGVSVVSRLGLNALAQKLGAVALYQFSCLCVCAGCVVWLGAHSYPWLVLFVVVLGIGYGGVAALTPAVVINMFGLQNLGELLGVLLTSYGLSTVVGPPIAGLLVDRSGSYRDIVWLALASSVLGVVTALALRRSSIAAFVE